MRTHEEYIRSEILLNERYVTIGTTDFAANNPSLLSVATHFDSDQTNIQDALFLLSGLPSDETAELKGTLDYAVAPRKTTRKQLRKRLTDEFKAKKLTDHKKNLQAVITKSRATHQKGALPKDIREVHDGAVVTGMELIEEDSQKMNSAIESLTVPTTEADVEINAVDLDAVGGDTEGSDLRQQPGTWDTFGDDEAVAIEGDQAIVPGAFGAAGRADFVKQFIGLVS